MQTARKRPAMKMSCPGPQRKTRSPTLGCCHHHVGSRLSGAAPRGNASDLTQDAPLHRLRGWKRAGVDQYPQQNRGAKKTAHALCLNPGGAADMEGHHHPPTQGHLRELGPRRLHHHQLIPGDTLRDHQRGGRCRGPLPPHGHIRLFLPQGDLSPPAPTGRPPSQRPATGPPALPSGAADGQPPAPPAAAGPPQLRASRSWTPPTPTRADG